ncbi:DUF2690 domain-containing protein [Streptomyces sp. NPDC006012]|uniref:DUF2690 domain-containing protein n=1 Tax=Streptomyces sp. NPDC006012 TaxID=3364739 RepID=UPI0036ABCC43
MTTSSTDDNQGEPSMTSNSTDDNSAPAADPSPQRGARRWFSGPAALAYAVAVVSAVVAAVATPLGDHVMKSFFEEPTCPGKACEGKNPQNQGCGEGARTFKPAVSNPALLQIRYSEDCNAVWAKIDHGRPGDMVTVQVSGGTMRSAEIEYGDDQFTSMAAVPDGEFHVSACVIPKPGGGSTFERYCIQATEATAWR